MRNPATGTVEVFKTDVTDHIQAGMLTNVLQQHFPGSEVHFDLDDCDKILRIEGKNFIAHKVMSLVKDNGFTCTVLE